ncbi:jg26165, partial [Pararge aegeria aegeria]
MRNAMMLILNKELFSFKTLWTVLTLLYTICLGTWPMVLFELTKNEVDIIKDILFKQSLLDT